MSQLVWFRNDLRTHDNPALSTALETNTPVSAVYVEVSQQHAASPHQRALKMHVLRELNRELAELGVTLQICSVGTFQEAAQAVVRLATHHNCSGIYANRDCGIHEYQRDQYVSDHFSGNVSFYGIDTSSLWGPSLQVRAPCLRSSRRSSGLGLAAGTSH